MQGASLFNARVLVISRSPVTPARLLHRLSPRSSCAAELHFLPLCVLQGFPGRQTLCLRDRRDSRQQCTLPARAEPSPASPSRLRDPRRGGGLGPRTAPLTCWSGLALWLWAGSESLDTRSLPDKVVFPSPQLSPSWRQCPVSGGPRAALGKGPGAETHVLSPVVPPLCLECKGASVSRGPHSVLALCSVLRAPASHPLGARCPLGWGIDSQASPRLQTPVTLHSLEA